jgi:ribonuclease D
MNQELPSYCIVENRPYLHRIASDLQNEQIIGVDLEADSLFHYQERVCLLQISTPSRDILVDPLALKDLSPLAPVFANPRLRKVFHGADYDIRSLYRDFGIEARSLFDTQIAARFLGFRETGLASLLKETLGLTIEKKYQRSDWSQRPLPSPMCAYAVQDSCHLIKLSGFLEGKLRAKGLLFCVEEECELLTKVRPVPGRNGPLFLKFKGAGKLDPRTLAVLETLLQFRDDLAKRRDCPPFKTLGNVALLEVARQKPASIKELKAIKALSPKQVDSLGSSLVRRIREALTLPAEALPSYPKKPQQPYDDDVAKRVKALRKWREQRAGTLSIDPPLTLTNAQINALALGNPCDPEDLRRMTELRNWQKQLFGSEICRLLREEG